MENKMTFRCYAYWDKRDDKYYACCIDLNLVDCADSMEEVIKKLEEGIIGYLQTVFEKPEEIKGLIPRKAPLSYRLQYRIFSIKLVPIIQRLIYPKIKEKHTVWAIQTVYPYPN